jgi:hypothetical protein
MRHVTVPTCEALVSALTAAERHVELDTASPIACLNKPFRAGRSRCAGLLSTPSTCASQTIERVISSVASGNNRPLWSWPDPEN